MTTTTLKNGKAAQIRSATPTTPNPNPKYPYLSQGAVRVLVSMPIRQQVRGRNVVAATLSNRVQNPEGWPAQSLVVYPIALAAGEPMWAPSTATWQNQPSVGVGVTTALPAMARATRFDLDVTSLVQAIAAGAPDYGFRIGTTASGLNRMFGFSSGLPAWELEIEFADPPEPPVPLSPLGDVVAIEPTVSWDFIAGSGDEDSEQAASRVWVNTSPTQTGATDSGWLSNELPEYDLSTLAGWTPTVGTTYYWQVQVRDGFDSESDPSDWASFVYQPKPSIVLTNPGAGVVWDPSPTVAFGVDSGVILQYRIRVFDDVTKRKRYDSGWTNGHSATSIERTLPFKWRGSRVHQHDDRTYRLLIHVRDRLDRVATGSDTASIVSNTTYVFDDDATPTAPSALTVAQVGDSGEVRLTWERASGVSTAWVVKRNGLRVARIDADDPALENVGTSWSWVDNGAPPYWENTWTVQAIDDGTGKQTLPCSPATLATEVAGVWLVGEDAKVQLDGVNVDGMVYSDSRAIYSPIGLEHDVDIVYALRGLSGTFSGGISSARDRDWQADLETLRSMRSATDIPVRLIYGTVNVPVILRDVSPGLPHPDLLPSNMKHTVTFTAHQVDEFGDDD